MNTTTKRTVRSISAKTLGRPLTQADANRARPEPGVLQLFSFGQGLTLHVQPGGMKIWRCTAMRDGVEKSVTLGELATMPLQQAILKRKEVLLTKALPRVSQPVSDTLTFSQVAERWMARKEWTPASAVNAKLCLHKFVLPRIGDTPIADINFDTIEDLVFDVHRGRLVNGKKHGGAGAAVMVKRIVGGTYDYAMAKQQYGVKVNPIRAMSSIFPRRVPEKHAASVETIEAARAALAAMEQGRMTPSLVLAHRLIALTGVRKVEALQAVWSEIDLAAAVWTIPAARMKARGGAGREHIVCLAPQTVELLRLARDVAGYSGKVFPSRRDKFYDPSALNHVMQRATQRAGLRFHPHGWRSTFVTIMSERCGVAHDRVLDLMLAHKPRMSSGAELSYQHAKHLEPRRQLACQWADMLLEGAPTPAQLIGLEEPTTNVVRLRTAA